MSKSFSEPSTPSLSGIVASTIGTAPRSPAQEMKDSSRIGIRSTTELTSTDSGLATRVSTSPASDRDADVAEGDPSR